MKKKEEVENEKTKEEKDEKKKKENDEKKKEEECVLVLWKEEHKEAGNLKIRGIGCLAMIQYVFFCDIFIVHSYIHSELNIDI